MEAIVVGIVMIVVVMLVRDYHDKSKEREKIRKRLSVGFRYKELITGIIDSWWVGTSSYVFQESQNEVTIMSNSIGSSGYTPNSVVVIRLENSSVFIKWVLKEKLFGDIVKEWEYPLELSPKEVLRLISDEAHEAQSNSIKSFKPPSFR